MKLKNSILIIVILTFLLTNISISVYAKNSLYENYKENVNNKTLIDNMFFMFTPDKTLLSAQSQITDEERSENNKIIIGTIAFLLLYWITLLIFFEKESNSFVSYRDDDEIMFKKYNPLIAGCIANSRSVLGRDIVAVILNLINKKIIKLNFIKSDDSKGSENNYKYLISRCKEKEHTMDNVEKYVHSWIFEDVYSEDEEIDLTKRLKTISEQKNTYQKLEELNNIATKDLNSIGANKANVPLFLKVYNVLLMGFILFIVSKHIVLNGLNIEISYSTILIFVLILAAVFFIMPLIVFMGYVVLKIFAYFMRMVNKINEHLTGQRIVSTTISIIVIFGIIVLLTLLFAESKYLILDEILIGVMLLIIKTDHLMLKNDKKILEDYYHLNYIKDKIEEYSLLSKKDIEHIVLWEYYLTYSISFGNSEKISNKIKSMYPDDKMIVELQNYDFLYNISKSYLEVFWEMDFSNKNKTTFFEPLLKENNFIEYNLKNKK